jgi:protein-disulfide isomerase
LTAALVAVALVMQNRGSSSASPTPVVNLKGIPQEGAVLGSPNAKATLIEYADIQCPACWMYTEDIFPTVANEYLRTGKVKTEFRGYPFLGDDSLKGERFLLAASEQNKLWQLLEAFYRNQGAENSGWLTDDLVRRVASDIPGLDVKRLFARAQSAQLAQAAQQSAADAQGADVTYTPTLRVKIGSEKPYTIQVATPDQLRDALNGALAG